MVVLFIWVISFMVMHPWRVVYFCWILIVVIHIFIILMPKLWHYRLGHIGVKRMKKLHKDGLLESLDYESFDTCESCLMGKMTKTPFSGTMESATGLMEIIHTDVCGPMLVAGIIIFWPSQDYFSRFECIYLMKHKSETFEKFKEFQSEVEKSS